VGGTEFSEGAGKLLERHELRRLKRPPFRYIPETVWNDADPSGTPSSGGGGVSTGLHQTGMAEGARGARTIAPRDVPGHFDYGHRRITMAI